MSVKSSQPELTPNLISLCVTHTLCINLQLEDDDDDDIKEIMSKLLMQGRTLQPSRGLTAAD